MNEWMNERLIPRDTIKIKLSFQIQFSLQQDNN